MFRSSATSCGLDI